MVFKVFFRVAKSEAKPSTVVCKILYADNGYAMEQRINCVIGEWEKQGHIVELVDCFNISEPKMSSR